MDETVTSDLSHGLPCRDQQLDQLSLLLDPDISNVATIVLHGTEATGKSLVIRRVLTNLAIPHAIVESRECITGRHLLERTVIAVKAGLIADGIEPETVAAIDPRCESISALNVQLQSLLIGNNIERFALVFDGIDKQREAPATLIPALARLGELIPALTTVLIVTSPRPRYLHMQGVPHVYFPPYARDEIIEIVALNTPDIFEEQQYLDNASYDPAIRVEDNNWLWRRFCGAVWDSLGKGAANDVMSFRAVAERLWPAFVQPIRRSEYGTRDFARLMVRNRALFQSEISLHDGLLAPETLVEADFEGWRTGKRIKAAAPTTSTNVSAANAAITTTTANSAKGAHELPYYGKFLLIAAFLASHNPARTDPVFFMKMHEKKRKKLGGTGYRGPGRPPKHRGITRKLLGPQPFTLERWLAVFHAIVPHAPDVPPGAADVLTQVATLAALRLIVKASLAASITDSSAKWRANVGLEYVTGLAKAVRFEVQDYLTE